MLELYENSCLKTENTAVGIRCAYHATTSILKKLALSSPTSGRRSVGIVRLRTKATEFSLVLVVLKPDGGLRKGIKNIFSVAVANLHNPPCKNHS
jgi:hypothetical protein